MHIKKLYLLSIHFISFKKSLNLKALSNYVFHHEKYEIYYIDSFNIEKSKRVYLCHTHI